MYKRKKNNTKYYIIAVIVIFILLTISLLGQNISNQKYNVFKNISMTINKAIMFPFTSLNTDKGKDQSKSTIIEDNKNSTLEQELQELKDMLELNKTVTEYETVNATILSRNKSYWFNTITIDKGTKSGIKPNMAVVTKNGFVGKISKVSRNSSEVKLITSDDINFKVGVAINTNGMDHYAIMNGYDSKTNRIILTGIDKTTYVNVGDPVVTSGLGEMFPAGIYIGEVDEIKNDKYNLSKIIYIKTKQNFNNIHYVTVLKVIS